MRTIIPAGMQGRVTAMRQSLDAAMTPLGLAIAGPVVDVMGVKFWILLTVGVLAVGGLLGLRIPAIRRIEDGPPEHLMEA